MPSQTQLATGLRPRDYLIEEYTTSVCPQCFAARQRRSDDPKVFKDAMLISRARPGSGANGSGVERSVYLRRFCEEHGESESLYEEDAAIWQSRRGWSTPTLEVTPDRAGNWRGFPDGYREGLPAGHGQHTCILLLNVTERCNYSCKACFASALPPGLPEPRTEYPDIATLMRTVETMLARENGKLGVVMLSGGEPTVRSDLHEIIERLLPLNITRIMLNTNGRLIAQDDSFLDFLRRHRSKVEAYLQYDGSRQATHLALRNEDVSAEKQLAMQRLNDAGVFFTLVSTVARGVNEEETGELLLRGMELPYCSGAALQPMFGSGRAPGFDPQDRTTPTGLLRRLAAQTGGVVSAGDFIPLPCSHPDCCDITYMLKLADGSWKSLPALVGREELKKWLHLVGNTITFDELSLPLKELLASGGLVRVFSEQLKLGTPRLMQDLWQMCDCIPGLLGKLGALWQKLGGRCAQEQGAMEQLAQRTFRITVKMFMDAHTFHEARIRQCCVHTGTYEADPRRYSFCWRWLFADAGDFPEGRPEVHRRTGQRLESAH